MITLVNPPYIYARSATSRFTVPPIGLAYIAAALEKQGRPLQVVDAVGDWMDQTESVTFADQPYTVHGAKIAQIVAEIDPGARIIGFTCTFSHCWPNLRKLIAAIRVRFPETTIIVGGEHPSSLPEIALQDSQADIVVIGEGEETICDLVTSLLEHNTLAEVPGIAYKTKDGTIIRTGRRPRIASIDTIAEPAWHWFPVEKYMQMGRFHGPSLGVSMPIMATRGCPYQCTFCTSPQMWTTTWQARHPHLVLDEMALYRDQYGANDFQFVDLTFMIKKQWLEQFCDLLIDRDWPDVRWQLPSGTRTEVIDAELAEKLYRTGCRNVCFAPESGSPRILKKIKKRVHLPHLRQAAADCIKTGIKVDCFFIIGMPGERLVDIFRSIAFMARLALLGVSGVGISAYRALPGTAISSDLVQEGRLIYDDHVYMGILHSNDFWGAISWHPTFPGWLLTTLKLFGYLVFYGLAFTLRPIRFYYLLRNRMKGIQETKIDRVFAKQPA